MKNEEAKSGAASDVRDATSGAQKPRPIGAYIIALFFTAVLLYSVGSLAYVWFFRLPPQARQRLTMTPLLMSLGLADLNLLLTVVATWLLVGLRRVGAGLLLASTVLVAALCAFSWPALIPAYLRQPSGARLYPLLMGAGNLVLHTAATVYAFRLGRKGLLR